MAAPPSPLERRGAQADAILDKFIAENLAADLMKMSPVEGFVEDSTHNWVLAGTATDVVLIDARGGQSFRLAKALPRQRYSGLWFDPATGATRDAADVGGTSGTVIPKPDANEWLLLLRSR